MYRQKKKTAMQLSLSYFIQYLHIALALEKTIYTSHMYMSMEKIFIRRLNSLYRFLSFERVALRKK